MALALLGWKEEAAIPGLLLFQRIGRPLLLHFVVEAMVALLSLLLSLCMHLFQPLLSLAVKAVALFLHFHFDDALRPPLPAPRSARPPLRPAPLPPVGAKDGGGGPPRPAMINF